MHLCTTFILLLVLLLVLVLYLYYRVCYICLAYYMLYGTVGTTYVWYGIEWYGMVWYGMAIRSSRERNPIPLVQIPNLHRFIHNVSCR